MSQENEIEKFTAYFRAFGAYRPDSWARSHVNENIPQYERFVFLYQAWQHIIADGDTSWINLAISSAEEHPRGPGAGIGPALKRLLALGAEQADIAEVVRVMQWQVLAGLAYQLADPGIVEYPLPDMPRVNWALFALDEAGHPQRSISALHESVLDTDPSGREMRPRGVTRDG